MTEFDPAKALMEEIRGLTDICTTLLRRQRALEQQHSEVEAELMAVMKLVGFAKAEISRKRDQLIKLGAQPS